MANWAGVGATLSALVRPTLLEPRLCVRSIAHLDWARLRTEANVDGVVIDKDNCIARPRDDCLAPSDSLRAAWHSLVDAFGADNILVVSNSAGDLRKDPLLLQAETLSRNLAVPVLVHPSPKPSHACVDQVARHFLAPRALRRAGAGGEVSAQMGQVVCSPLARSRAPSPAPVLARTPIHTGRPTRILVIGDRLATDMILAHRLSALRPSSLSRSRSRSLLSLFRRRARETDESAARIEAIPILTTHLWAREGPGTTLLRLVERAALWALRRRRQSGRVGGAAGADSEERWERFVVGEEAGGAAVVRAVEKPADASDPPLPPASALPHTRRLPTLSLDTLRALPTRLVALPTTVLASLRALPHAAQRRASRALYALEARLPALLAQLGAPDGLLARGVRAYKPAELAPRPTGALSRREREGEGVFLRAERWVGRVEERVEGVWGEARRRAASAAGGAGSTGRAQ